MKVYEGDHVCNMEFRTSSKEDPIHLHITTTCGETHDDMLTEDESALFAVITTIIATRLHQEGKLERA